MNTASIPDRISALLIDLTAFGVIVGFTVAITGQYGGIGVSFVLGFVYQWYFLTQNDGQTPGKMLMNLKVVRMDGRPLQIQHVFLRSIGYLINTPILGMGWWWAIIDDDRQGWHDKLAGTIVVLAGEIQRDKA